MFSDKIKQSKSDEFFRDFDLYKAPHGDGQSSSIGEHLPDIFETNEFDLSPKPTTSKLSESQSSKSKDVSPLEKRMYEVTRNLMKIHKRKRMHVFHEIARTTTAQRSKEFFLIYSNPREAAKIRKNRKVSKLQAQLRKPKKPFSYEMEYEKLRGLRESEEELAKVQKYIDKMIEKNIKKLQEEKRKQEEKTKKVEYHYPTLMELVRLRC